ncbi:protein-disulfide reductase DsbD family protein [Qipengyuania vesicularis]|uniref:protein-disulfide reductase DsbD family protein n=1 Tax=Qipengyuania vesicularis TaxID=2867232 RepID=UPI001C8713A7|nr:protein-disulfide reductase DsbD [Qipengyuania vesicularis]MBX7527394.1 thioredoxin family protein [Qipengyuania vesicularis]
MDGWRWHWALLLAALALLLPATLRAQEARFGDENISVELRSDGAPVPGETWMLALHFAPSSEEWHGYWSNPGDAGQGMDLQLNLPEGWEAGEPLYPVPQTLVTAGLMNHIYEGEYAVLVPIEVPEQAAVQNIAPITGFVSYLACTDRICVPQDAALRVQTGGDFDAWRAQIAPLLDSTAGFEIVRDRLRVGFPIPEGMQVGDVHMFLANTELGGGLRPDYAGVQTLVGEGNLLVVEMPLERTEIAEDAPTPEVLEGILSFGSGQGVRFRAEPRDVPLEGVKPIRGPVDMPSLWILLIASLAGGLLLNIMPCVFPILSLKALALAKAGGDEASARRDALAYTAGVVLACAALGALILLLRSAGEQVGWAFQLQEPRVVGGLFLLAVAITANFLGLFQVPGMAIAGGRASMRGSFGTGLLAAFVATPCTGPFMALALGAALVLRPIEGFAIFTALGVGLALPFLLLGFIPAWRRKLPKPGAWMERFRRWMAVPMGLTVLALAWLLWRIADDFWLVMLGVVTLVLLALLASLGRRQAREQGGDRLFFASVVALVIFALSIVPAPQPRALEAAESVLDPGVFSEAALAEARTSGKPVFVWFTADWCLTCKVNEQVAIEREETRKAFEEAGVMTLRGDWTLRDEEIAGFLAQQGAAGVPLYLWYPPGGDARQLPQVLTPDLLVDLAAGEADRRSE